MARVNVDFIPTISDIVSEDEGTLKLVSKLNNALARLNEIIRQMSTAINTVEFGDGTTEENVLCNWIDVTFGAAGTELSASHTLGRAPKAIVGSRLASSGDIYFSSEPTSATIFLKSDATSLSGTIIII